MIVDGFISLCTQAGAGQVAGGRVYRGVLPRGYTLPAVAVHRYNGTQDYDMNGPVGIREDFIQVDAYGDTAVDCETTAAAVRSLFVGFTGALPDGTVVQGVFLERDMDMPFLPHADSKAISYRSVLGFRIVSVNAAPED